MATPKKIVYADTNAIIEATRTGCLKGILNLYDVRTVEEVRKESLHVPKDQKSFVKVDEALFRSQVNVSPVKEVDILRAAVKAPGLMALDNLTAGFTDELPVDLKDAESIHRELVRTLDGGDSFWPLWLPFYRKEGHQP